MLIEKLREYSVFLLLFLTTLTCQEVDSNSVVRNVQPQIIGGVPTEKGEFPWVVSIQQTSLKGPLDALCVGTIISPNKVVTAAHCVKYFLSRDLLVVAGAWNLSSPEPTQQIVKVYNKWIHPDYDEDMSRNDLAILEVMPLGENEFVKPVRFPPPGHNASGSCIIAGWGQTLTESTSDILLKGTVPIVSPSKCFEKYQDLLDSETQVCAGHEEGGVDACLYDTGGPLVCEDLGYKYFAGIVSWGSGCAEENSPGVYTKVSHYVNLLQP